MGKWPTHLQLCRTQHLQDIKWMSCHANKKDSCPKNGKSRQLVLTCHKYLKHWSTEKLLGCQGLEKYYRLHTETVMPSSVTSASLKRTPNVSYTASLWETAPCCKCKWCTGCRYSDIHKAVAKVFCLIFISGWKNYSLKYAIATSLTVMTQVCNPHCTVPATHTKWSVKHEMEA